MQYIWNLDPVAFHILGLEVRWYGIVYVLGFFLAESLGWFLYQKYGSKTKHLTQEKFQSFVFCMFVFSILGARLGYFLFYDFSILLSAPLEVFFIWNGGMSIHGGILGALGYALFWSWKHKIKLLLLADVLTIPFVISLFLGRLANFVNGELFGRLTDQSWGVVFPHIDNFLRHPSQLYEAGKNLFLIIFLSWYLHRYGLKNTGRIFALFLLGYGVGRFIIEYFREPERYFLFLTMGQFLCLFMIAGGGWLFFNFRKQ